METEEGMVEAARVAGGVVQVAEVAAEMVASPVVTQINAR